MGTSQEEEVEDLVSHHPLIIMECLGRTQARRVLGGSKTNGVNRGIGWEQQYQGRRNNDNKQLFQATQATHTTRTTRTTTTRKLVTKMPVAVPRVPYRTPQEGNWQWVDLWNCLYRDDFVCGTGRDGRPRE